MLATCSEDKTCKVWKQDLKNGTWSETNIDFDVPLWKVSWSMGTSALLAISGGEDQVVVMCEDSNMTGQWGEIDYQNDQ